MGKGRAALACTGCGYVTAQWVGRCPSCGAWGTFEDAAGPAGARPVAVAAEPLGVPGPTLERISTGFDGIDRVLGGGLVPGSVTLMAGEPGIGKSTLLLQVLANLAASGRACLVASGEESREQVGLRAARLGVPSNGIAFVPGRDLPSVVEAARGARADLVVVDSIQAIRHPDHPSLPGGPAQVRACADALVGVAKEERMAFVLVGQVTKDGDVAGPRTLEHAVDVVCSFEGDTASGLRLLAGGKNRFGPEGEVAWFEMGPGGLREVEAGAVLARGGGEAGAAVALVRAGRRALAVEVQALVVPTDGPPRRQATGLDLRRFGLLAAVVDRVAGIPVARSELYGATAGGLRVEDPGADLAVAAALASAASGIPPSEGTAFAGEVSLTGAIRAPAGLPQRLQAAKAAGIGSVVSGAWDGPSNGVRLIGVASVAEALDWVSSRAPASRSRPGVPAGPQARKGP